MELTLPTPNDAHLKSSESLAENLWVYDEPLKFGLLQMNHRMSVVRLQSGPLWIHSPVQLTESKRAEIERLGEVAFFVAPSTFHDLYWKEWFEGYPGARFCAVPGMREAHSELPFNDEITGTGNAWEEEIETLPLKGIPKLNETVFLHRSSRTLIVADLLFNLVRWEKRPNPATKLMLKAAGTYGHAGVSRLFRMFIKDRKAMRHSLDEVLSRDFDRVVVGHGDVIETGGKEILEKAWRVLS